MRSLQARFLPLLLSCTMSVGLYYLARQYLIRSNGFIGKPHRRMADGGQFYFSPSARGAGKKRRAGKTRSEGRCLLLLHSVGLESNGRNANDLFCLLSPHVSVVDSSNDFPSGEKRPIHLHTATGGGAIHAKAPPMH